MLRIRIAAIAAALAFVPALAAAQEAEAPPAATEPPSGTIGPRDIQDFNLNGTVTRPAPQPTAPAPAPTRPAPSTATPDRPAATPPATAQRPTTQAAPAPRPQVAEGAPSVSVSLPPADALTDAPVAAPSAPPAVETDFAAAEPDTPSGGISPLPWIIVLALAGAGAALYFWRQRSAPTYAAAGSGRYATRSTAAPRLQRESAPVPVRPRPAPAPAEPVPAAESKDKPPGSSGVVTTRLRPWVEIEFAPGRCIVEAEKATIEFEISLFNSGSAPARDVLIEASLLNAGPTQDQEISAFFGNPVAKGERIPSIPPMKRVALKSAVSMPAEQMRRFEAAGRQFFVPLIGFNALYRWSAGEGQTSSSFLLGRDTNGEKMAPFRLDLGPRVFRGLGAREHSLRVRN